MNTDTFMCSSDEKQTRSPLSLYSEYQRMEIEFRAPHIMPTSHWHGQVEVNGEVEYQRGKKLHEGDESLIFDFTEYLDGTVLFVNEPASSL